MIPFAFATQRFIRKGSDRFTEWFRGSPYLKEIRKIVFLITVKTL